ncbi:binding-protein-dependent transport systems inner membrane component [Parasphaerochaeta coccoides DSM 17374]|uniref:Binding-protein-dependent transport systems inner membrane component n=2 Tax=Parasphaerochaeta TaxID=3062336 RepID=F4GK96_PARC1|nr:binding-protein-dependent transport systems inner membrane component [Parasphaerochaeta coccoides DSM 17374]
MQAERRKPLMTSNHRNNFQLHMMLVPGVVLIFLFSYLPMFGLIIAFQNFSPRKGFLGSDFIGLNNFAYVLKIPGFWRVVCNTLLISIQKIVLNIIVPVFVALLLNELTLRRVKKVVQTIVYFPHFLSWVILAGLFVDILSPSEGFVNSLISLFGGTPVFFLGDKNWFPFTMVLTDVWKEFGYGTIVYLATLSSIDPTLYEAAGIDGAGRLRQAFSITIPALMPTIMLMGMLSLGSILNAGGTLSTAGSSGFEQIYNLYSPQVFETGDIIETLVFRLGLAGGQYSVATAIGLVKSLLSLVLMSLGYWIAKKKANYEIL